MNGIFYEIEYTHPQKQYGLIFLVIWFWTCVFSVFYTLFMLLFAVVALAVIRLIITYQKRHSESLPGPHSTGPGSFAGGQLALTNGHLSNALICMSAIWVLCSVVYGVYCDSSRYF